VELHDAPQADERAEVVERLADPAASVAPKYFYD
jgi:uncharacterized SAM-dependent methyltransferase